MGHVVGQDQEAFDQRSCEDCDDGKGNVPDQIAKAPTDENQPPKRDDRREGGGKDRHRHTPGGILGRDDRALTIMSVPVIGVLTNHDGVIDHDPQRYDQSEERDHIDREPAQIHQRDCRHHRDGDTRRDPKGGAGIQEQEQQAHDQRQPDQAIVDQQVEAASDCLGPGSDQLDRDGFGQRCLEPGRDLFNCFLNRNRIALGRTIDPDRHGGFLTHKIAALAVAALNFDLGDVPHRQL